MFTKHTKSTEVNVVLLMYVCHSGGEQGHLGSRSASSHDEISKLVLAENGAKTIGVHSPLTPLSVLKMIQFEVLCYLTSLGSQLNHSLVLYTHPMPANHIFCIFIGFVPQSLLHAFYLVHSHSPPFLCDFQCYLKRQDEEYPIAFGPLTARSYLAANITGMLFETERSC